MFRNRAIFSALFAAVALMLAGTAWAGGGGVGTGSGGGDRDDADTASKSKYAAIWDGYGPRDKEWARETGECESGNDPDAVNRSGPYYGAFQFLKSTWKSSPRSPGGKPTNYNWKTQAVVAVELKKQDGKGHWPNCG